MVNLYTPYFSCSSLPKTIQDPTNNDLQLVQVLGQIDDYVNRAVRRGGKIITVNNDDQQSLIQIVHFRLMVLVSLLWVKQVKGGF